MVVAPKPLNENARLKALFDYDILDTQAEKVFDDLTLLASQICQTPIALISLIDPDRQWFKAKIGLDAYETSRDIAFCAHAIHQREVFEVTDTLEDERFADNPLVTGNPNIRFYAGAQLVTPEGFAIGTLCAIDKKPKKLTEQQINSLEILSREVISQLELRSKLKMLEAASNHKTDFLANMSHELRTPINAILNFSRIIGDRLSQTEQNSQLVEYVGYIDSASGHLLDMVNSVLDLTKIEQGKMTLNLDKVLTHQLFERLHGMMSLQATEKLLTFEQHISVNVPTILVADEAKLRQILLNLISNAIKFTDPNGTVKIDIDYRQGKLNIVVSDNGCGISLADQKRLFQKFEQVGQNHSIEGSGLGLNITKGLVELMGGTIELKSQLGYGTTVNVTLPLKADSQQKQAVQVQSGINCKSDCQVLVVEDSFINQQVQMAIFEAIGIDADLAKDGMEAINMVTKKAYDLVFMDLHLPDLHGEEVATRIAEKQPNLPIVALTADVFYQMPHNSVMKEYITKPIVIERMIEAINLHAPKS